MLKSMTAYARKERKLSHATIAIELRSVNHRFLEISLKIPDELRMMEIDIRNCIKGKLSRGKLDVSLQLQIQSKNDGQIHFNSELAAQLAKSLHEIDKVIYNAAPVNAIDILNWPGVLDSSSNLEHDNKKLSQIQADVISQLSSTLDTLIDSREREGEALKQTIIQRCKELSQLIEKIREDMPNILQLQRERLEVRLQTLKVEMNEERLEQEVVLITQKADIDEELDRLDVHLIEINRIIESNEPAGRCMDFIMQELNREANTMGSKSISTLTTQASVDMKVIIEQMREQIQNIE